MAGGPWYLGAILPTVIAGCKAIFASGTELGRVTG